MPSAGHFTAETRRSREKMGDVTGPKLRRSDLSVEMDLQIIDQAPLGAACNQNAASKQVAPTELGNYHDRTTTDRTLLRS